jgi:hypothetical protein
MAIAMKFVNTKSVNIKFYKGSSLKNASIIEHYSICMHMYMERRQSKMHFMLMHSNNIATVKHSECRLKYKTEVCSWDQEAAVKTGE